MITCVVCAKTEMTNDHAVVFLDETWLNSHAAPERIWVDSDETGGFKHPSGNCMLGHATVGYQGVS